MAETDAVTGFTVDTHILRELGALLVGRDSTALLELVKNSYDAEATTVSVDAQALGESGGLITITDDGNGMTYDRFVESFLRIAGRTKETDRDSPVLGRRFTGAKGIGRLAAHKLAAVLEVVSVPKQPAPGSAGEAPDRPVLPQGPSEPNAPPMGVEARLDWDDMESEHRDLSNVGDALTVRRLQTSGLPAGTTMKLSGLRGDWTSARLGAFLDEVRKCRPNKALTAPLAEGVVPAPLLFTTPKIRQHNQRDPGMHIDLTGDLSPGDDLWDNLTIRADWVVEILAECNEPVRYAIAPTVRKRKSLVAPASPAWAEPVEIKAAHPDPERGPFFQARFFITEGTLGTRKSQFAEWARREAGVSVFMEGFRVLPYGTNGDDWLELDRDAARKEREYDIELTHGDLEPVTNEGFSHLGNRAYFGAVFLTDADAPHLQAVVNREGFVPDAYFLHLRDMVRTGANLATRVRAALDARVKAARQEEKAEQERLVIEQAQREAEEAARAAGQSVGPMPTDEASTEVDATDGTDDPSNSSNPSNPSNPSDGSGYSGNGTPREADDVSDTLTWGTLETDDEAADARLRALVAQMRTTVDALEQDNLALAARTKVILIGALLDAVETRTRVLGDEQMILRTLAGLGTLYSAFVHEVNGLLGQSKSLRDLVDVFPQDRPLSADQRATLRDLRGGADDLVQSLTRQTSYLTEIIGPDARRRRRRMKLRERVEIALRLLTPQIAMRGQHVSIDVDPDVTTPPIFAAELAIILTNLLTNATKFAQPKGRIRIAGYLDDSMTLHVVVENTGDVVSPRDAERFFRPFESTTTQSDEVLGQGLGLGLPIVRSLLEGYDGRAEFVTPSSHYATAIEVQLPDPRPDVARRRRAA